MKILCISNSSLTRGAHRLPLILNKLSDIGTKIEMAHVPAATIRFWNHAFDAPLCQMNEQKKEIGEYKLLYKSTHLWYEYGNNLYKTTKDPEYSLKDIILSDFWDVIILAGYNRHNYINKDIFNDVSSLVKKIREISHATLYWWSGLVYTINTTMPRDANYKYESMDGINIANNYNEFYDFCNKMDERICGENNLIRLNLREAYRKLTDTGIFPNIYGTVDVGHCDGILGCYFVAGFIYNSLLRDVYRIDLKDIKMGKITTCKDAYSSGDHCIYLTESTKYIADEILNNL